MQSLSRQLNAIVVVIRAVLMTKGKFCIKLSMLKICQTSLYNCLNVTKDALRLNYIILTSEK